MKDKSLKNKRKEEQDTVISGTTGCYTMNIPTTKETRAIQKEIRKRKLVKEYLVSKFSEILDEIL